MTFSKNESLSKNELEAWQLAHLKETLVRVFHLVPFYKKKFEEIAKEILERGYFRYDRDRKEYLPIIEKWAEKEILFYDPLELKVTGNSRIYEKGLELLLERHT